MKRFWAFLVAVALCFCLVGCDSPAKETENKTYGLNETATLSDLKFTASELKESEGATYFEPEEGNVFVGVKFTVENVSDEEQTLSSLLAFEAYVDDVKCDYSISAAMAFDEGTVDGTIAPGKKLVGWYALEVPKTWSALDVQIQPNLLSNKKIEFHFEK